MIDKNSLDRSMHEYYEKRAAEYDDWYDRRGPFNNPATNPTWHAQVADLGREATRFSTLLNRPGSQALDLACGTGKWSPYWLQNLPESGRLIALDYSPAMLAETRARLEETDENYQAKTLLVRGDAYALPFADSSFNLVFTGFWLSHVPSDRLYGFLSEIKRVLKPGGSLLAFDSALRPGVPASEVARRQLRDGSSYEVLKINYSPDQLEAILKKIFSNAEVRQTRDFFLIAQASI